MCSTRLCQRLEGNAVKAKCEEREGVGGDEVGTG